MDYEIAVIRAVTEVFPDTHHFGCLFHLHQNMKKHVEQPGLVRQYRTDAIFAQQARMIVAIAFVPIRYMEDAYRAMENHVDVRLQPIMEWFGNNYMGKRIGDRPAPPAIDVRPRRRPLFAHEMWNVNKRVENDEERTNNQAEGANHTLTVAFSVDHPTMWKFIDGLRLLQVGRDANYELMVRGGAPPAKRRKYQDADTRIIGLVDKFNRGGDIIEFLRGIANNSAME